MKRPTAIPLLFSLLFALSASAGQTYFNSNGGQLNVGWQDKEGKTQQLSYRLDAGKLPPLIAYRPARMQEDVLQGLLQQAGTEFPEVQFSLSRPDMKLHLKSRNQDKAREALAWATRQRSRIRLERKPWVRQAHARPYRKPTQVGEESILRRSSESQLRN